MRSLLIVGAGVMLLGMTVWVAQDVPRASSGDSRAATADITPSGPAVGTDASTFLPSHVTGPHAGRTACPVCVYGQQPGVAIWARDGGLEAAARTARDLERALASIEPRRAVGYVVYLPDASMDLPEAERRIREAFSGVGLERVFLTVARPADNGEEIDAYRISADPSVRTTTVVYSSRVVRRVLVNLAGDQERVLRDALADGLEHEEPYGESTVAMCAASEPGRRLEFYGQVIDMDGVPLARASVVAYQTDASGEYAPREANTRMPRLRGVAITDERGWFRFRTVRPGGYPGRDDPEHIHLTVTAPMHEVKYVTYWFEGDPRLTPAKRRSLDGETVIVVPRQNEDGSMSFRGDVRLQGN